MVKVVCAGHVNWDVTVRLDRLPAPDRESKVLARWAGGGGSAANVATALAGLSVPTGVVGAVGDDEIGRRTSRELSNAGVDTEHLASVPGRSTTVKYLLLDEAGEVSVLGDDGANEAVAPGDVDPEYVRAADHLHLTGQRPETATALAEVAVEADVPVSFDPGRRFAEREFGPALELADVVFVNDREAEALLTTEYPTGSGDRTVVVKHGDCGAAVHGSAASVVHEGFDVDPVDTTGAGDAFAAGFLAVWLDERDPERALAYANACGALATRQEGARFAPERRTVESLLDGVVT